MYAVLQKLFESKCVEKQGEAEGKESRAGLGTHAQSSPFLNSELAGTGVWSASHMELYCILLERENHFAILAWGGSWKCHTGKPLTFCPALINLIRN